MEFLSGFSIYGVLPIIVVVLVALTVLFAISRFAKVYRIVPPDEALVISGGRHRLRIIVGGAAFVWPLVNTAESLSLKLMLVKKSQDAVKTKSGMTVLIDWFAQTRFKSTEEHLKTAARLFLGKDRKEVAMDIEEVLSGNVRAIAGNLTAEQMHNDRDAFIEAVQKTAEDELSQLGVEVILGIQEITDDVGYFDALAGPGIAKAKERDRVAKAEANRIAGIAEEQSRQEVEQKRIDADTEILTQKEALELREVEKKRQVGIKTAEADKEVNTIRKESEKVKQEADKLVPARAEAEAVEIKADGESQKITKIADASAHATEVEGLATAKAEEAKLKAEASGKRDLAEAIAAQGRVNLITPLAQILADADVEKTKAMAEAVGNVGEQVKIWDFSGGVDGQNTMTSFLDQLPPMIQRFVTQTEALTDSSVEDLIARVANIFTDPTQLEDLETQIAEEREQRAQNDAEIAEDEAFVVPDEDEEESEDLSDDQIS